MTHFAGNPRIVHTQEQIDRRRGYKLLEREIVSLNGPWRCQPDPDGAGEELGYHKPGFGIGGGWFNLPGKLSWREVDIPCTFDHCGQDMNRYEGVAWFRRDFDVPESWARRCVTLRFEGVNYVSEVWVNGEPVGGSPDGQLRFEQEIDRLLRFGQANAVVVKVDNTGRPGDLSPGINLAWYPEGGIARDVELHVTSRLHMTDAVFRYAEPAQGGGRFKLAVSVANHGTEQIHGRVFAEIVESDGTMVGCYLGETGEMRPGAETEVVIEDDAFGVIPWSPDSPTLYTAHLYLLTDEERVDTLDARFGFRKIEARWARLFLNGEPIFLTGFNRHEDSPRTGMAFDEETVRADLAKMKDLGVNFVRLCHYPHSPRELDLYDELGFVVLGEIPLIWWTGLEHGPESFNSKVEAAHRQLRKMVRRDMNHPSIILWSVSNETRVERPEVLQTNESLLRLARELDPSRLIVHVSCHWSEHFDRTDRFDLDDVICMNQYPSMAGFADPAQWWRDEADRLHELYPEKPIVVTEFGYNAPPGGEEPRASVYETEFGGMDAPYICGASIWGWADHPYPEDHTGGPGLRYGLCTRDREMHPASESVRRMYTERQARFKAEHCLDVPAPEPPTYDDFLAGEESIRQRIDMAGTWWCQPDRGGTGESKGYHTSEYDVTGKEYGSYGRSRWRQVRVPCIYDDCGFDMRQYSGQAWFHRDFAVPDDWQDKRVIIRFEGIHWQASIWLNGEHVYDHADGLLRLDLDLTDRLRFGSENTLVVRTDNTYRNGERSPGPITGYFADGGITREVELIATDRAHISSARFLRAEPGGEFHLLVGLADVPSDDAHVVVEIADYSGRVYWSGCSETRSDGSSVELQGKADGVRPWSPEDPALYVARISLVSGDRIMDRECVRFGFRKIEVIGEKLYLNGEPVFLYGTDIHEDSHRTGMAVGLETLRRDLIEMKRTGINFVRMAHAPRGPSALDVYDEVGMMVLSENNLHWWLRDWVPYGEYAMENDGPPGSPNFEGAVSAARRQLRKMIERDMSHPCIIMWSVGNENCVDKPGAQDVISEMLQLAKRLDPSRPVVHVSCNYWGGGDDFAYDDIICVNGYFADPQTWREEMVKLRDRYPAKPVVVTEFGFVGILGEHKQATIVESAFRDGMVDPWVCGACAYSWVDVALEEWEEACETVNGAYGIAGRWREKREAVAVVRRMYAERKRQRGLEQDRE